jgi:hypothetical protein
MLNDPIVASTPRGTTPTSNYLLAWAIDSNLQLPRCSIKLYCLRLSFVRTLPKYDASFVEGSGGERCFCREEIYVHLLY